MIRLATIGTNFITDWFMEGVQELEEIKLTAVYSRNLEKGKQFAAKYGVEKVYNNYEEMAQDPEIDAVYVASPTYMHYAHSITMINYGYTYPSSERTRCCIYGSYEECSFTRILCNDG